MTQMLEVLKKNFKMTMTNIIIQLEKVENIHKHNGNFSRDMETLIVKGKF